MGKESKKPTPLLVIGIPETYDATDRQRADFLDLLYDPLVNTAWKIAVNIHGEDTRKIKDTLYLGHVAEVAFITYIFASQLDKSEQSKLPTIAAAALLHDAIEMHPINRERKSLLGPGIKYNETVLKHQLTTAAKRRQVSAQTASQISRWVAAESPIFEADGELIQHYAAFLEAERDFGLDLPLLENDSLDDKEIRWRARKRADIARILIPNDGNSLESEVVLIKIADSLAVLNESIRDVIAGIDQGNNQMFLPSQRLRMFQDRRTILGHFIDKHLSKDSYYAVLIEMLEAFDNSIGELRGLIK